PPPPPPPPGGDGSGTAMASLFKNTPYLLMQRTNDNEPWQRVRPNTKVGPNTLLVSLPGSRSLLQTTGDVDLMLWGNVPEFLPIPLLESAVRLQPSPDVDLELTLERGRVLVANRKAQGPARVRVHFNEEKPKPKPETWEITLAEPGTEVALD